MIDEVNKIIFNMLISGRGVYLPEVGTLYIERQAARRIDKNRLMSPRNVVAFSSHEQAPSLVDEIMTIASCQREQAQDIYERWSAKTRTATELTIGGVGVLRGKSFVTDKTFATTINPKGVKTLVVRKKSSHAWIYAVGAVAVVVALAFFAYLQWGDEWGIGADKKVEKVVVAPVATEPVADAASADAAAETTPQEQVVPVQRGPYAYYVVMGVFSTEENAGRAVDQLRSNIKDVGAEVLPFGSKYMVTAYGSDSRAECNTFISSYRDIYPDLWVYNKK